MSKDIKLDEDIKRKLDVRIVPHCTWTTDTQMTEFAPGIQCHRDRSGRGGINENLPAKGASYSYRSQILSNTLL